jgi:hypothetical protein
VHRLRAALSLTLLVAASLALAGPAFAGGPTSALLTVPGTGTTASLYYTDPEYDALAALVGVDGDSGGGVAEEPAEAGHENGPGVTVTWLIHDVMPWRVDHIYLEGKGAPWIASQVSIDGQVTGNSPVRWHQPTSGPALVALLDKLGVGQASREAGDFNGVAGAQPPASASPAAAPRAPTPVRTDSLSGIWWGLGGLATGLLLSAIWVRRRRSESGASTEQPDDRPQTPPAVVAEEVSWP